MQFKAVGGTPDLVTQGIEEPDSRNFNEGFSFSRTERFGDLSGRSKGGFVPRPDCTSRTWNLSDYRNLWIEWIAQAEVEILVQLLMNRCDEYSYPVDVKLVSPPTVPGTPGRASKAGEMTDRCIYGPKPNRFCIWIGESFHRPTIDATWDPGMLQRSVQRAATGKGHEGCYEEEPAASPLKRHVNPRRERESEPASRAGAGVEPRASSRKARPRDRKPPEIHEHRPALLLVSRPDNGGHRLERAAATSVRRIPGDPVDLRGQLHLVHQRSKALTGASTRGRSATARR